MGDFLYGVIFFSLKVIHSIKKKPWRQQHHPVPFMGSFNGWILLQSSKNRYAEFARTYFCYDETCYFGVIIV